VTAGIARRTVRLVLRSTLLLVAVVAIGNGAILGASFLARTTTSSVELDVPGVKNAVAVDQRVWRGAAPSAEGYRHLAEAGVTTVVDLRHDSERDAAVDVVEGLGIELVRLPIRDGQLPSSADVARFLEIVDDAESTVFVHCGAGVGRTGAMAAAYLVAGEGVGGVGAARRNLAVGPPSLEQIAFAAAGAERPPAVVTALSRVLDAPRRIWHNL